jgi:hypothetical protein
MLITTCTCKPARTSKHPLREDAPSARCHARSSRRSERYSLEVASIEQLDLQVVSPRSGLIQELNAQGAVVMETNSDLGLDFVTLLIFTPDEESTAKCQELIGVWTGPHA